MREVFEEGDNVELEYKGQWLRAFVWGIWKRTDSRGWRYEIRLDNEFPYTDEYGEEMAWSIAHLNEAEASKRLRLVSRIKSVHIPGLEFSPGLPQRYPVGMGVRVRDPYLFGEDGRRIEWIGTITGTYLQNTELGKYLVTLGSPPEDGFYHPMHAFEGQIIPIVCNQMEFEGFIIDL